MIFDNKQFKVPYDSYVSVNNQVFDADVYIELPTEEKFSYSNCVVIFFIPDLPNRKYFQYNFYKTFSDKELKEADTKGYEPYGVYLFFKDEKFLEDFKRTNNFVV
ncbi:hypothetical protein EQG68_11510 [Flavobacterium piscinae]|uniref:Uncharacterized protein n=2 Tax=Flavobacterium piscinae TaxID=2506424 RepID=A0A4Q1KL89_9FLAO|nr:hypothetical protein [Flavobacterium piscinae]RXR30678.1 hypothetical protein EQG68_11510 [Flavobacterium piscinae]